MTDGRENLDDSIDYESCLSFQAKSIWAKINQGEGLASYSPLCIRLTDSAEIILS